MLKRIVWEMGHCSSGVLYLCVDLPKSLMLDVGIWASQLLLAVYHYTMENTFSIKVFLSSGSPEGTVAFIVINQPELFGRKATFAPCPHLHA